MGEFSKEAPLPEGSLLRCEAKCTVRLDDVYMVVEPDTVFSVTPAANRHELYVQEGTIYYSLSESSPPLEFSTPAGEARCRTQMKLGFASLSGSHSNVTKDKTKISVALHFGDNRTCCLPGHFGGLCVQSKRWPKPISCAIETG